MPQKIQCRNCKDIIQSLSRHDFNVCSCFTNSENNTGIFIDGGDDYMRVGGDLKNIIFIDDDTKIYTVKPEKEEE